MHHPFQAICACSPGQKESTIYLIAASGSRLLSINLKDGTIASSWQPESVETRAEDDEVDVSSNGPPSKKRRVASSQPPDIVKLGVAPSQSHIVAVTGQDKCIRVFEISSEGRLNQLSERCMPKRPCAIAFTSDSKTIISGDKFGDVFAIPLLPTQDEDEAAAQSARKESKPFAPAATTLTVHSKANRRALEAQLKQAKETMAITQRDPLAFAHKLLLGHVSLLTDVVVAEVRTEFGYEKPHCYLLTSDRDEHIRVSRGPPQSYVIEGYCLGHKEFISKLCLARSDLLVSGGGDDYMLVWDWRNCSVKARIRIKDAVFEFWQAQEANLQTKILEHEQIVAVSGLWLFQGATSVDPRLLIACEGVPALFHCPVSTLVGSENPKLEALSTSGNVLDVTFVEGCMIVSSDNIHERGSIATVDESTEFKCRLEALSFETASSGQKDDRRKADHLNHTLVEANELMTVEWHEEALKDLLYNVGKLRKHDSES